MKPRYYLPVILSFLAVTCLVWAEEAPSAFGLKKNPTPAETAPVPAVPAEGTAQKKALDLAKVSRLLLVTLEGVQQPSAKDGALLAECPPAGVVIPKLFRPAGAKIYIEGLRARDPEILIGADLYEIARPDERGGAPFMPMPPLLALAAADDPEGARNLALLWGEHLRVMGFNLCLGPRLGLAPNHPEANGTLQCLGADPAFAAEAGTILCQSLETQGVVAMPMDFPGGGFNRIKQSPAVLSTPKSLLVDTDLRPYLEAIRGGARVIHVGPILAPTLDEERRPACVSKTVITQVLREALKFDGVIVAGPVDAPEIRGLYSADTAALMAIDAGADLVYVSGGPVAARRIAERLSVAVREGQIPKETVDAALTRVAALRTSVAGRDREKPQESRMAGLENRRPLEEAVLSIERQAITLVQNRGNVLPLLKKLSGPVGVTGVTGVDALQAALEKHLKHVSRQDIVTARHVGEIEDFEIRRITANLHGGTIVCVLDASVRAGGAARLIREIKACSTRLIVVYLGYPKHLDTFAEADALLLAYSEGANSEETWKAIAEALTGQGAIGIIRRNTPIEMRVGERRTFDTQEICRTPAGQLPVKVSDRFPVGISVSMPLGERVDSAEWDFGNGDKARGAKTEYAYTAAGQYTLTLHLKDNRGKPLTRGFSINVSQ